ncbi:unnamed protein product [Rotaria sp. Silwood2]|nr:unnamed protein product [Rotaria sp. Silwood2]
MVELHDIEMKEVDPSNGSNPTGTTAISKDEKKDADTLTFDDIKEQVRTIEKAVNSKEPRFILRVLRGLASTRKRLNEDVIRRLILFYYGSNSSEREILLGFAQSVSQPMDVDMEKTSNSPAPATNEKQSVSRPQTSRGRAVALPEVDLYIHLIVLLFLIDRNSLKSALDCAKRLVDKTSVLNRRTLDLLSAKCYFYYARIFELNNMLDTIRPFLHSRLRTATLRNDFEGTAVLINLLLRNYLHYNLYILLMTMLFTGTTTSSVERYYARGFFFNNHKTSTISTTNEESSFRQSFNKWLNEFLSGDSNKEKNSNSFSKLALLKQFLFSSSSSSSSNGKSSKLDKLFQLLNEIATDDKNQSSSSTNKLNKLLQFFNTYASSSSSHNIQLALKLINLAQGNGGFSSLSISDMKSLINFIS